MISAGQPIIDCISSMVSHSVRVKPLGNVRPEILFLDEPPIGLDPQSRHLVWETIDALRDELGLTVFLTSHYQQEDALIASFSMDGDLEWYRIYGGQRFR